MNIKIFCRCSLFPSWSGWGLIYALSQKSRPQFQHLPPFKPYCYRQQCRCTAGLIRRLIYGQNTCELCDSAEIFTASTIILRNTKRQLLSLEFSVLLFTLTVFCNNHYKSKHVFVWMFVHGFVVHCHGKQMKVTYLNVGRFHPFIGHKGP
jgi:hypothetical protein